MTTRSHAWVRPPAVSSVKAPGAYRKGDNAKGVKGLKPVRGSGL